MVGREEEEGKRRCVGGWMGGVMGGGVRVVVYVCTVWGDDTFFQ